VAQLTYPGVYIEELPSGVRTITGVSTSTTAFVGRARKGLVNTPVEIHSFGEFDSLFGGLWDLSTLGFSVQQYFLNGGQTAVIVRVTRGTTAAATRFSVPGATGNLLLEASSPGTWGDNLRIAVDTVTADPANLFNIVVSDPAAPDGTGSGGSETIRNLSADTASPRFLRPILEQQSRFVRVAPGATSVNKPTATPPATPIIVTSAGSTGGSNGTPIQNGDVNPTAGPTGKQGMYALEDQDIFNILVIPPLEFGVDVSAATWAAAAGYCRDRRAFLIVDPPTGTIAPPVNAAKSGFTALAASLSPGSLDAQYAAYYFPRFTATSALTGLAQEFAPSGAIAGIYARTDSSRGVWKAPAGLEAGLNSILDLTYNVTDGENGSLNPLGVNCLRTFNLLGSVVWGARTVQGSDALASDWKYVPVRRLALYIEESLFRGTQWVVFEPNDEPLWAQIRLNVGAFMQNLFRQGAFQGLTPRDAYFVKCDAETTTQNDINLGIVNILVGFAPLKPAEFVVIKIQQMAGQVQA
jgi:phage tail sheath protein FI